jgi:hypothetical protein
MIKNRTWIIIFSVLLLISLGVAFLIFLKPTSGSVANVYIDGELIRSIDLSEVTEGYEFTVQSERGINVVRVEKGRICVKEADCPDKVCVRSGWLKNSAAPICCLPHKLVIKIEKDGNTGDDIPDAVSK